MSGVIPPEAVAAAVVAANIAGWADAGVTVASISVESTSETEWHQVFFVSSAVEGTKHSKIVVNFPSWEGAALLNKIAASKYASDTGIGPTVLGEVVVAPSGGQVQVGHACEWLAGGTITDADVLDPSAMREVGALYGRLHRSGSAWFDATAEVLRRESRLSTAADAGAIDQADHAQCLWIIPWMLEQVPAANRAALASAGVDWDFIAAEIRALPTNPLLPTTETVTCHGDSHAGNIMRDGGNSGNGGMRLIDFDMTARGPAGADFGFIVLMLFRCGFALDAVVPEGVQRAFARGYLSASAAVEAGAAGAGADAAADPHASAGAGQGGEEEVALLRVMHAWVYYGLLKMGLLCAVLMANEGHAAKRAVMRERGPVLLHPEFLSAAKECLATAQGEGIAAEAMAKSILSRGLFFEAVDTERWKKTAGVSSM